MHATPRQRVRSGRLFGLLAVMPAQGAACAATVEPDACFGRAVYYSVTGDVAWARLHGSAQAPASSPVLAWTASSPAPQPLGGGDHGGLPSGGTRTAGCRGAGDHTSVGTEARGSGPWF